MSNHLPCITDIETSKAIELNGCSYEDYIDSLNMYYRISDKKASDIITALENHDIENYTIYIHALKSASKVIGAFEFAEKAYKLELEGRNNNWEEIIKLTPALLKDFEILIAKIAPCIEKETSKITIERVDLIFLLEDIRDYLSSNELVLVEDSLQQLKDSYYNEEVRKLTKDISYLTDNMKYAQCVDIINEFIDRFTTS